ncbi:hypothetical protein BBO99_00004355 [Phytophthora kernoviae]|uniref:ABC transmembrane type-1 domain-containing protein n=1 Tax=Phytophthora kernoviae TaxID=325452 RepID=A0A3R7K3F3_9STRA|nr:hypothetical protein JM16_004204 [Phytophthora kernoviae]KAG2523018.1 hypothetical protein JM18_003604 [Phytophthora kernoviae]RLN10792.1 hypothetical protein BBI17_004543 [Phytophthora kernoviae]RLN80618.1 hypothetical protein BBO99_00004355 [Phytophthora kernoviae]
MNTSRKVVTNCFASGSNIFPDDAAVVIVTHSLQLLPLFPMTAQILIVGDGNIIEQGTYNTLKVQEPPSRFMSLLESLSTEEEAKDKVDGDSESQLAGGVEEEGPLALATESQEKQATQIEDEEDSKEEDEEHRESGVVGWHVWKAYSLSVGWVLSVAVLLSVAAMQISRNSLDWWVAVYTNGMHATTPHEFATVLLYIAGANIAAVFIRSFLFAYGGLRAARATYATLIRSVFAAPLQFFERTPTGRVLNRMSGDIYAVDESLPFILNLFLKDAADVIGALIILFYGNRLVLVLLVPLSVLYFHLQRDYRPSSRHLRRLDAAAQSPLLAMFTDTLEGLIVIRAAYKQRQYARGYYVRLNRSQRVSFLSSTAGAWFGLRLDMLGVCVTSFVAVFAVADFNLTGTVNPGILGLTLTYALPIVGKLNSILNSFVDTERQMIAVERVKEYADLEPEETVVGAGDFVQVREVPPSWPTHGVIAIKALTVTYATSTRGFEQHDHFGDAEWEWVGPRVAAPALRYVTCDIPAGQKLGICGRTGAGKSTLLNALFRVIPWERSGSILIDGLPLDSISLQDLRSNLTYIPQDVVLFSGTVRSNLDPTDAFNDERLWSAIASEFATSTVLTVAHRIQTIMHCDRVLLLDNGRIAESGDPKDLANNPQSLFYRLANASVDESKLL